MSLSPVPAVSDMVAPVVLISVGVLFSNGLLTTVAGLREHIFALDRERLRILRGPHGEILEEDSLPPADRERLAQIRDEAPALIRRGLRIRNAILIVWITVGLLVVSVAAIAVAVTAHSEAFAFTGLALVIAGVAGMLGAVVSLIGPVARAADIVMAESRRTRLHG